MSDKPSAKNPVQTLRDEIRCEIDRLLDSLEVSRPMMVGCARDCVDEICTTLREHGYDPDDRIDTGACGAQGHALAAGRKAFIETFIAAHGRQPTELEIAGFDFNFRCDFAALFRRTIGSETVKLSIAGANAHANGRATIFQSDTDPNLWQIDFVSGATEFYEPMTSESLEALLRRHE